MFDLLPQNVIGKIYQFDFTYHRVFNLCLLELELNFHHKNKQQVGLSIFYICLYHHYDFVLSQL